MQMIHHLAFVMGLTGLVLAGWLTVTTARDHSGQGSAYTVAQLRRQLARDPRSWVGRPVRVRGVIHQERHYWVQPGCKRPWMCVIIQRTWWLTDPRVPGPAGGFPLHWGSADHMRALLRRVPLLGLLVPPRQVADPEVLATYEIALQALPPAPSGSAYGAVLRDAAPDAQGGR